MEQAVLWIWLQQALGNSAAVCRLHQKENSIVSIYEADRMQYIKWNITDEKRLTLLCNKNLDKAHGIYGLCTRFSIGIMTIDDADYPALLREIPLPPCLLFYKGDFPSLCHQPAITLIGTRSTNVYGEALTREVTGKLAVRGLVPVSGFADGIETLVHTTAISLDKPSIMVMPAGLLTYSGKRKQLISKVAHHGAVISECLPGETMPRYGYVARNRIMAGLSPVTVLLQAPKGSGALTTAYTALEYNREIYAAPGALTDALYAGCIELLQQGASPLVNPLDLIDLYLPRYGQQLAQTLEETGSEFLDFVMGAEEKMAEQLPEFCSDVARRIYNVMTEKPSFVAQISDQTLLSAADVLATLSEMEMLGIIESLPGGAWRITK